MIPDVGVAEDIEALQLPEDAEENLCMSSASDDDDLFHSFSCLADSARFGGEAFRSKNYFTHSTCKEYQARVSKPGPRASGN